MAIAYLHRELTTPTPKTSRTQVKFWFGLSLAFAAVYGILGWQQAFSSDYAVQDDARQHVFWMLRFLDPELFPNNLIADYFQSVAPAGYATFYRVMAALGVNPLLLNKLLPPVLGLLVTGYCFGLCLELLPIPATGFIAALMLNQQLWLKDDLISGTPRAFAYPLFLAFLYYVVRRSLLGTLAAIALLGLFYPQCLFIAAVILVLRLADWENGRFRLSQNRQDYLLCAAGLGVALLVMLPYVLTASEFGPAITAAEARTLPEFLPGGRATFFHKTFQGYWINGRRSSMFPKSLFTPVTLCAALLWPLLLAYRSRFPLLKQVTPNIAILPQLFLASVGMFFAAHALLFKLHLPSRYTGYGFRVIVVLLAAIALSAILDAIFRACQQPAKVYQQVFAIASTVVIGASLVLYPSFVKHFPLFTYRIGAVPSLYQFFQQQPKDILIASLSDEANNLPTFAQRSILVGSEYAVPYHVGYYRKFRQQIIDLIRSQYSPDLAAINQFIQKYGVDFWLLDASAFTPEYLGDDSWMDQFQPVSSEARSRLEQGTVPALATLVQPCTVFKTENLVVLEAECIAQARFD